MRCKISWEKVHSEFRGVCLKQGKKQHLQTDQHKMYRLK